MKLDTMRHTELENTIKTNKNYILPNFDRERS